MMLRFDASATGSRPQVYRIENWYTAARNPHGITFRPSLKTLLSRFVVTTIAAITIGLVAGIREVADELGALSGTSDAVLPGMNTGFWILSGIVAAIGILSPVSTLWQKMTLSRTPRGGLETREQRLLGSTREWPLEMFRNIAVIVQEHMVSFRGAPCGWGYLWRVGLVDQHGYWCVELQIDRTKIAPLQDRMSERTRECVEALQQITGLHFGGTPIIIEHGGTPRAMNGLSDTMPRTTHLTERRGNITEHVTTSTESHTYQSLEEMPPEVRARVEGVMAQGRSSGAWTSVSEQITVTDENGTRTYTSVEEMPPDVRAQYEEARRKFRRE